MDTKQIGLTASQLFRRSNKRDFAFEINSIVKVIDSEIISAHDNRQSEIGHELPTSFNINGLTAKDAQILVYSELIKIYRAKGFTNIFFKFAPSATIMYIKWINIMAEGERSDRKKMIDECTRGEKLF